MENLSFVNIKYIDKTEDCENYFVEQLALNEYI
jgi:hypothetical protein